MTRWLFQPCTACGSIEGFYPGDVCTGMYVYVDQHIGFLLADTLYQVKDEAVALVDVVALPDHILGSPIGHSNGKVKVYW